MVCVSSFGFTGLLSRTKSLERDLAQGTGRYVAGENNGRDMAKKLFLELRDDLEAVHAVRQIVVCEDEIGSDRPLRHQVQRRDAVGRRCDAMALVREEELEELAHLRVVLDDQDRPGVASGLNARVIRAVAGALELGCRRARWAHHLDGEDRALAGLRADPDPMAQQLPQALHDGEAQAQAPAPFAGGIVELMVLVEDRFELVLGDADSGVPDLDAQHSLRAAGTRAAPCRAWCI